ncbi:hypothetical protein BH11PLA1_BH11PLA1_20410 [soil metagenome]
MPAAVLGQNIRAADYTVIANRGCIVAAQPPGDPHRLMLVGQGGRIDVVLDGVLQAAPFFTVQNAGVLFATGGEQGLLGMAFAPDYATTRRFYIYFTGGGNICIARCFRSDVEDLAQTRVEIILTFPHFAGIHNGGCLRFGPDGMLYFACGDDERGSWRGRLRRSSIRATSRRMTAAPGATEG